MTEKDYDELYMILADSDIMQHYPYTLDEARVRGWISCNIERYLSYHKSIGTDDRISEK